MFKKIKLMLKLKKIYNRIKKDFDTIKRDGVKGEIIINLFDYLIVKSEMFEAEKDILSNANDPAANSVKLVNFLHGFTSRLKAKIANDKILTYKEFKEALTEQLKKANLY